MKCEHNKIPEMCQYCNKIKNTMLCDCNFLTPLYNDFSQIKCQHCDKIARKQEAQQFIKYNTPMRYEN